MARIQFERKKTVPIVVVEDRYNLAELPASQIPTDHIKFVLEDFQCKNITSCAEPNRIAQSLDLVETKWVLIDFGQHDQARCVDFIQKLSRYSFMSHNLRNRSLIFTVPAVSLVLFARVLNESFNNLPASGIALAQPSGVRTLFWSVHIERVLSGLLLANAARRVLQQILSFYPRRSRIVPRD